MPSLLINADDFGLTPGVNRAIAELHDVGCLLSTTLMATGRAFDEAVTLALARPALGVGCHIVLTDGLPALPPAEIPSLLGPDGVHFRPALSSFIRDLMLGRLNESELEREAAAQIRRLQSAGLRVTHFDTHKHTHLFPAVVRPLARAAKACRVDALRNPFEPEWSIEACQGAWKRRLQMRSLARLHDPFFAQFEDMRTPDGTLGISATGKLDASSLASLLKTMPDGQWELVCHPGYNDAALDSVTTRLREHRAIEYAALLQQIPAALRNFSSLRLISFNDLQIHTAEAS